MYIYVFTDFDLSIQDETVHTDMFYNAPINYIIISSSSRNSSSNIIITIIIIIIVVIIIIVIDIITTVCHWRQSSLM